MVHSLPQVGQHTAGSTGANASIQSVASLLHEVAPRFQGAYIHVPFCFHKCHYCDFYSFVDQGNRQPEYVNRLEQELAAAAPFVHQPLRTVFVGGGTPTLLEPRLLGRALSAIRQYLPLATDVEWSVEANPETVTPEVAQVLVESGVNRVSMGAQSFHPHLLKALERWHEPASVARAMSCIRAAGIHRVNIDLIFGIPGASLQDWQSDLAAALALSPSHISCYGLTYESNTAMTRRLAKGEFARCAEDVEAAMYQTARDRLGQAGMQQYEISNWAHGGEECRHNLLYWRNEDWMAFGPSASGHAQGLRWKNVPRLGDWLAQSPWSPVVDVERVGPDSQVGERLMMGLRLTEGVPEAELTRLLHMGEKGAERRQVISTALMGGLLEFTADPAVPGRALRFTPQGQLLADSVLSALV